MRKEVLYAILAGIVLGLVVAFGVWRINTTISANKTAAATENPTITLSPSPTVSGPQEFKIVLDKPSDDDVITQSSVNLTGLTKPDVWIAITGTQKDYVIKSDAKGTFTQEIELTPGINQVTLTAFQNDGSKTSVNVRVVSSTSFQERTTATATPSNASAESDIRQKVANDINNIVNKPKAYIGTVTDITESTIEIKNTASDIKQISVNPDSTSVLNNTGTQNKQVKVGDVAIGDFIVAMGYIETSAVLGAQRILIIDPPQKPNINLVFAKVTGVTKKALTVTSLPEAKEDTVQPDTKTLIVNVADGKNTAVKFSSITENNLIIYTTTTDAKNATAVKSVFILPQS